MPSAAAIYCRISDDKAGEGLGVARQEEDCRAWAQAHDWTLAEVYVDNDISAYAGRMRPGYRRLLDDLTGGRRDGLIVWHPDRLHRSPKELEGFIEVIEATGIPVATVTAGDVDLTTATGRMTARIVGAVARHESEHKAERIRRKALQIAQAGGVPGGGRRAFGYEPGNLVVREAEAELIREAARRVLAGEGVRTVAADWNARGVPTVTGTAPWQATTIKRILTSERVVGWRELHGRRVAPAQWPAILSEEDGRRLRRLLEDPARATNTAGRAPSYLLSGYVVCGACAAKLTARPVMRKGHRYRRYACLSERGGCNRVGIGAEPLEELVVEAIFQAADTATLARQTAERRATAPAADTVEAIEDELQAIADERARGELTRAEWATMRERLVERLDGAKRAAAADVKATQVPPALLAPGVLRREWPAMSLDRRRVVLEALLDAVVIAPTTKAGNRFDPGRVDLRWRA